MLRAGGRGGVSGPRALVVTGLVGAMGSSHRYQVHSGVAIEVPGSWLLEPLTVAGVGAGAMDKRQTQAEEHGLLY